MANVSRTAQVQVAQVQTDSDSQVSSFRLSSGPPYHCKEVSFQNSKQARTYKLAAGMSGH